MTRPSMRRSLAIVMASCMVLLAACATDAEPSSSPYTTVPRTDSVRIRIIGDTPGVAAPLVLATGSGDAADYSVSASALGAWLDLPRENGDGAVHDQLVQLAYDDPDLVVASLGGDLLVIPDDAAMACATASPNEAQRAAFAECLAPVLDRRLVEQRVMAIAFDVLAHTHDAKLLLVGHGQVDPSSPLAPWQQLEASRLLDAGIAAAVASIGDSGATWADRVAYTDRADLVTTARARGWL